MPRMNGFEFVDELLNLAGVIRGSFKIVILTSSHDPYDIRLSRESEFISLFINKPLNKEKLSLLV